MILHKDCTACHWYIVQNYVQFLYTSNILILGMLRLNAPIYRIFDIDLACPGNECSHYSLQAQSWRADISGPGNPRCPPIGDYIDKNRFFFFLDFFIVHFNNNQSHRHLHLFPRCDIFHCNIRTHIF